MGLPFENATGDASRDDWQQALPDQLRFWLNTAEFIGVRDGKETRAVLGRLGWTAGCTVDARLAGQAATKLKADALVWGRFLRQTNGWLARARILRAGSEATPAEVDASSPVWADLAESLAVRLAEHLGRPIKEEDRQRGRRYLPTSEAAAACYAKAIVLEIQEAPASEREKMLHQVLALERALGLILYKGNLVPRDHVAAVQWILLATDSGHSEARRLLKEMELLLSPDGLAEARKRAHAFMIAPREAATGEDNSESPLSSL